MGTHRELTPLQVPRHSPRIEQASYYDHRTNPDWRLRSGSSLAPTHRDQDEGSGETRGLPAAPGAGARTWPGRPPARPLSTGAPSTPGRPCTPLKGARMAGRGWPASLGVPGRVPGGAPPCRKPSPFLRAGASAPTADHARPTLLLPGSAAPEGSARTLTLWSLEQVAIRRPWKSKDTSWMRSLWSAAMLRATNMAPAGPEPFSARPSRVGGGQPRPRADHGPPGPRGPDVRGACGLRAPGPAPRPGMPLAAASAPASPEGDQSSTAAERGGRALRCFGESDKFTLLKFENEEQWES